MEVFLAAPSCIHHPKRCALPPRESPSLLPLQLPPTNCSLLPRTGSIRAMHFLNPLPHLLFQPGFRAAHAGATQLTNAQLLPVHATSMDTPVSRAPASTAPHHQLQHQIFLLPAMVQTMNPLTPFVLHATHSTVLSHSCLLLGTVVHLELLR